MKRNGIAWILKSWLTGLSLLTTVAVLNGCRDEEIVPEEEIIEEVQDAQEPAANEVNSHVNSWILENMEYWYLWNEELPAKTDKNLDPEAYFASLLHEDDRFSWIQENYQELLNSLQGISKEAGYEYVLYREKEGSDQLLMQVKYIKPSSPA